MDNERLKKQMEFLLEIDKLKTILRRTLLTDGSRRENSAEHSWHLAIMALILSEYANTKIDLFRVIKILLIHDLVEIDAGDTFVYDLQGNRDKEERERRAAERLFGLLPPDQAEDLHALWKEFEEEQTPEALFASALDRLQPLLHNYFTQGTIWRQHQITGNQVLTVNRKIERGSPTLWNLAESLVRELIEKGFLPP